MGKDINKIKVFRILLGLKIKIVKT